jgi:hypothetical protein
MRKTVIHKESGFLAGKYRLKAGDAAYGTT